METLIGIVAIFFVLYVLIVVIGKLKGAPDPKEMAISQIEYRLTTETAWLNRYLRLSVENQQKRSLQQMYEQKKGYVRALELELSTRRMVQQIVLGTQRTIAEAQPILDRITELQTRGTSQPEATKVALAEWKEKTGETLRPGFGHQAPTNTPAQEHLKRKAINRLFVHVPTEEAKQEAMRIGLAKHEVRLEAAARDIDVASALEAILANLKQGDSLRHAIIPVSWGWSAEQKDAFVADIEQEKARGVLDPDAIRAALTRFSTR